MSRSSPVIDWQQNYERDKIEGTRPNAQRIYPTERIQSYWNVGVQLVGIIPNWCDSKKSSSSKFPYQRPLMQEERLTPEIKSRRLFGYVQCDLKVPEHLKAYFANFRPIFKNTVVVRNDIGDLMKENAKKEGIMSQPRRMLISSFHLKMELSSLPYCYITCIVVLNVQKCINSFSILARSVSVALYSLPSMLEDKEMKMPTQA